MSVIEDPWATWIKRFHARHYSYRDYHRVTTQVLSETQVNLMILQALSSGSLPSSTIFYRFGDNARSNALMNMLGSNFSYYLWPRTGDPFGVTGSFKGNCYAREVLVHCSEDAWIRFVSVNPEYIRQNILYQAKALNVISAPQLLWENERMVEAGVYKTYRLTYGYGVVFRGDSAQGTLELDIEGNVEGGE